MSTLASDTGDGPLPERRIRVLPWLTAVIVGLLLSWVAAVGWDLYQAKTASESIRERAAAVQEAVSNRDVAQLATQVELLQESANSFASHTDGLHWWLADRLPWVKSQSVPLRQAASSIQNVANDALAPLTELPDLEAFEAPSLDNGRIDPWVLEPYREPLVQASDTIQRELAALEALDLSSAISLIDTAVVELREDLRPTRDLLHNAAVTAQVLPTMLAAEGERTYLVVVQNNAEPRTTGGIPGSIIELSVKDGQVSLQGFVPAGDLATAENIDAELTADEREIFTDIMLRYPQDANFTPEFPRTAELITNFWFVRFGEHVDGVLSIDPIGLSYMLEGMEPVQVGELNLRSDNLAEVLLNQSYLLYPNPADQDQIFAAAAAALFEQLLAGGTEVVSGVERAIDSGRFMAWSAEESEQQQLQGTRIAGSFMDRPNTLGVFINDGSGSKIGYYVDYELSVTNLMCSNGTLGGQRVELEIRHTFNGDVADLPWYVSGGGQYVPEGEFAANVLVYPVVGTGVASATVDGQAAQFFTRNHDTRMLASQRIALKPGQSVTLQYEIQAFEPGIMNTDIQVTPVVRELVPDLAVAPLEPGC